MNSKQIRAWIIGLTVLAASYATWFTLIENIRFSDWAMFLLWLAPLFAAFGTSYLAPSKKIILGASLAIPAALFSVAANLIFQAVGRAVDFPGFKGGWILLLVTLSYTGVLSLCGAWLGVILTRWRENRII